jgi:hypothetical protein
MEHVQMKRPWKKSRKAWKKELQQRLSPEAPGAPVHAQFAVQGLSL